MRVKQKCVRQKVPGQTSDELHVMQFIIIQVREYLVIFTSHSSKHKTKNTKKKFKICRKRKLVHVTSCQHPSLIWICDLNVRWLRSRPYCHEAAATAVTSFCLLFAYLSLFHRMPPVYKPNIFAREIEGKAGCKVILLAVQPSAAASIQRKSDSSSVSLQFTPNSPLHHTLATHPLSSSR